MKTRIIIICLVCIVLVVGVFAYFKLSNTNSKSTPKNYKISVIGDSIAKGYGLDENVRYSSLFSQQITDATSELGYKLEVANSSTNGITTAQLLEKIKSDDDYKATLDKANVVCISIGGNDLLNFFRKYICTALDCNAFEQAVGLLGTQNGQMKLLQNLSSGKFEADISSTVSTATDNIGKIVAELKANNSDVKVYVQTIYNPICNESLKPAVDLLYNCINDPIKQAALASGYEIVDVYQPFHDAQNKSELVGVDADPNGFPTHPSAEGHLLIANEYYKTFNSLFGDKLFLSKAIVDAKAVDQSSLNAGAEKDAFNKALKDAQRVEKKNKVTKEDIDSSTKALEDCMQKIAVEKSENN